MNPWNDAKIGVCWASLALGFLEKQFQKHGYRGGPALEMRLADRDGADGSS